MLNRVIALQKLADSYGAKMSFVIVSEPITITLPEKAAMFIHDEFVYELMTIHGFIEEAAIIGESSTFTYDRRTHSFKIKL